MNSIHSISGGWQLNIPDGQVEARFVINAAGVDADKVHAMVAPPTFQSIPCRGEYYLLDKDEGSRVSHVIFQCPTEAGKGVLVSPTVHGKLLVGPNAQEINSIANTASGLDYVARMAQKSVPRIDFRKNIRNFAGVWANTNRDDFIIEWAASGFLDLAGMKSPGLSAAAAIGEYTL